MTPNLPLRQPGTRDTATDFWSDYAQGKAVDSKVGTTVPGTFKVENGTLTVTIPLADVTFEDVRKVDEMVDDGKGGKRRKRSATLVVSATADGVCNIPFHSSVYQREVPLAPKAAINLNIALAPAKG
jgi:hypothetical protein